MSLINSLHSFFLKLSRPATIAAITVITLLFLWLINFQGVPGIPPIASLLRIGLPDMMFAYSPSSIFPVELPNLEKLANVFTTRQVDFRRSQYCIVARGNFAFADSQSSSSSFCLGAWTGLQCELTHRGASLHA
jgi:hypothetical protein